MIRAGNKTFVFLTEDELLDRAHRLGGTVDYTGNRATYTHAGVTYYARVKPRADESKGEGPS